MIGVATAGQPDPAEQHFTANETAAIMGRIHARGDRLMAWFVVGHLPIALFLAAFHDTWAITLATAPAITALFLACVRWLPRTFFTRCMAGVVLQAFCALHIYQMHGQPEQHFWFFAAFTMMIVYQDWLSMWPGALLIIAQHIVFALMQNAGYNMLFFPEHHIGFWKLFFHFGIALVQVGICGYWAHLLRRQTLHEAAQQQRLGNDIAERAMAAEALRMSEQRTRLVIETALDAVILIDEAGRISDWNPQAVAMFGWRREEIIGRVVTDVLFQPSERDRHWQGLRRLTTRGGRGGARHRFEMRGMHRTGREFPIELTVAAVPGTDGILYSGFVRDLTEQHRVAAERHQLEVRMQEAQQRESLGVLAGGIAHDFNNLLVGILGNAGLARLDLAPESPVRGALEDIEQAAKRASDLANEMLAYAGKGKLLVQPVRLSGVVQEITHLIGTVISKKAMLELRLDDTLPTVEADATQLRQVVMNLITNASDALDDRPGVIAVTTRTVEMDAAGLAQFQLAEGRSPGRYVALEVVDSGKGMDAATLARIFDPFYTTKFTGRGLGLASVLGIVRSHRGVIRVTSEPGRGTTFTVLLPPAAGQPQPAPEPAALPAAPAPACGVVLVVDDEEIVRVAATRLLSRNGYEVLTASDGLEGIDMVRHHGSRLGAVLLDLTMPHLGGEETLKEMRRIAPDLPVILTSGYSHQEMTKSADRVGFLAKPYRPEDLFEAIRVVTTS